MNGGITSNSTYPDITPFWNVNMFKGREIWRKQGTIHTFYSTRWRDHFLMRVLIPCTAVLVLETYQ